METHGLGWLQAIIRSGALHRRVLRRFDEAGAARQLGMASIRQRMPIRATIRLML